MKDINYHKLDWKYKQHLDRYKSYVNKHGLICQECGGCGEEIDDSIDFGNDVQPIIFHIYQPCGWCEGIGKVTKKVRGLWLRCKKEEKNQKFLE